LRFILFDKELSQKQNASYISKETLGAKQSVRNRILAFFRARIKIKTPEKLN